MREILQPEARIEVGKSPLLQRVYQVHEQRLKNPETPLPQGFESGKEVERRYQVNLKEVGIRSLEDIDAFFGRLLSIPGAYARQIEQVNVSTYMDGDHTD